MSEHNSTKPVIDPSAAGGVSRRRLMRAGLSAAPVVLALKSNSVLATGSSSGGFCVKPSTFASLGALAIKSPTASQAPRIDGSFKCHSHGYWKNKTNGLSPETFKTDTPFLNSVAGFTLNPGGAFSNLNLQQVMELQGNDNSTALARHIVAAYLTARVNPTSAVLSVTDCQNIWNSGGSWSPVAGDTSWNTARWVAYFDFILG